MSNSETHLVPAIVSFLLPGVGQMLKGQIMKGIGIIIASIVVGVFLYWTVIIPFVVYIWNIYDAYTDS